jgi:phage tail sheath protein FI
MPVTPTYPGVYIEEITSGVRTITGVATSIAAFVGWAARGPMDKAQLVLSFQDYVRNYGGLDARTYLGYALNQFFANGGNMAYVIRLAKSDAKAADVTIDNKLKLTAKNPGAWAKDYAITTKQRSDDNTRFALSVVLVQNSTETVVEAFPNLSMSASDPRFVVTVLANESQYLTASIVGGATTPPADTSPPSPKLGSGGGTVGDDGTVLNPNDAANSNPAFDSALMPSTQDSGVYLLDRVDLFNLLVVPGETNPDTLQHLQKFCRDRRAFLIADAASNDTLTSLQSGPDDTLTGADAINAAFYFPWVNSPDPLQENRPRGFPPSGFVAGAYVRTDAQRGVWKAPAGTEASLTGVSSVTVNLTNGENGVLNPKAINCIRNFPVYGTVVWGARTLQGNDERGSEWKYVPVRRTALFLEESLYRGTQWVVFEPNDEPLWAQIRLNVGAFMQNLFRQGAFQGKTPQEAYFVKCDKETTTQNDVNLGIVNIVVGFAPLKPAEFVIIQIHQMAGQIQP